MLDASDMAAVARAIGSSRFEGIICDVPCSGSGTWARTPEACYFFQPETLSLYTKRQFAILKNSAGYLTAKGRIIYITCSVFQAENDDVVTAVAAESGLVIESSQLIKGIPIGADSLFVSVLRKPQ